MGPQGHPLAPWGGAPGVTPLWPGKPAQRTGRRGGGCSPRPQSTTSASPGPGGLSERVPDSPCSAEPPPPPHTGLSCVCFHPGVLRPRRGYWCGGTGARMGGRPKTQSELCKHRPALGLAPPARVFLLPPHKGPTSGAQWHLLCGSQGPPATRTVPAPSPQAAPSPALGRGPGGPAGSR